MSELRSEGDAAGDGRERRFLKHFTHGFVLSILAWIPLYALSFIITLSFQPISIPAFQSSTISTVESIIVSVSTYWSTIAWTIILLFLLLLVGLVVIGIVNSLLTYALWLPTKLSIRKSIVDGLAFIITSSSEGLACPLLLLLLFFLQYSAVLLPYYLGLPPSTEFVSLLSLLYLVLLAPLYGKIGKDIILNRLECREDPPHQARTRIMDLVSPSPHSELIVMDNSRSTRISAVIAQAKREMKERKTA